jgi:diguanylate cyclase
MPHRRRSLELGRAALSLIEKFNLSADPGSYQLWYTYVAGSDPTLNRAVDAILVNGGPLSEFELENIRRGHLAELSAADRIADIGQRLGDEVEQVVGMIEAAIGLTAEADDHLVASARELHPRVDRETLRSVVQAVISITRDMQQENAKLGRSLRESRQDISTLQERLISVRTEALTDALTGLANRRHLDHLLERMIAETEHHAQTLSLLLVDVDHFKSFNDRYGHPIGDQVLRLIGETLKQNVRAQDVVARFGGEEFAVILPETELAGAAAVAEHLRAAIAEKELVKRPNGEKLGRITVSIGVARTHGGESAHALLETADTCLYAAKQAGRNCVVQETHLARGPSAGKHAS